MYLSAENIPVAKNMWGGAFFGPVMEEIFPDFWKEAPVERSVGRHSISLLTEHESLSFDFRSDRADKNHGFVVLRAKFDQWLAAKAEQAGAIIAAGLEANELLYEGGAVAGVKVGDESFPAECGHSCRRCQFAFGR